MTEYKRTVQQARKVSPTANPPWLN